MVCLLLCEGCEEKEEAMFGIISGTVISSDTEEPVADVTVSITPGGGSKVTGIDGTFLFEDLDPQEYSLTFVHSDYNSLTKTVSVNAGVNTALQVSLSPIAPELSVSAESLDFGNTETTLAFDITNSGKGALEWAISESLDWLSCSPASGSTTGETSSVVVIVSRDDLDSGTYSGSIDITSNGGGISVAVKMYVDVEEAPTVTVDEASDITYNCAVLNGTVVSIGTAAVTRYGFCWSEHTTPSVEDNVSNLGVRPDHF